MLALCEELIPISDRCFQDFPSPFNEVTPSQMGPPGTLCALRASPHRLFELGGFSLTKFLSRHGTNSLNDLLSRSDW